MESSRSFIYAEFNGPTIRIINKSRLGFFGDLSVYYQDRSLSESVREKVFIGAAMVLGFSFVRSNRL